MSKIDTLISQLCPEGVKRVRLGELAKVITAPKKLGKKDYLPNGLYPIVDQGQKFVIAYTNDESVLVPKDDYVIFGDHTREIKFVDFAFAQGADGVKILRAKACILPRFLYYSMTNLDIVNRGYNRHWTIVQDMEIPLPPLPIQEEIVKILDRFAVLTAELEAELEDRRKQYEYYRTLLLDFSEGKKQAYEGQRDPRTRLLSFDSVSSSDSVRWMRLGEVAQVLRGRRLTKAELKEDGIYPVYHGGLDPLGFYDKSNREGDTVMVIDVGASAGTVGYSKSPFWSSDGCYAISHTETFNNRFLYYALLNKQKELVSKVRHAGIPTLDAKVVEQILIPIPSLPEQERIVNILDKFDQLVNGVKDSIPALIDDVQKQYEFYRNKLLTFPE